MPSKQSKDYDPLALVKPLDRSNLRAREFKEIRTPFVPDSVQRRMDEYRKYKSLQS